MINQDIFGKTINWLTAGYFLIFGLVLISTSQGDIVLWFNDRHTPFFDQLFKYGTFLGDGIVLGILGLFLLLTNYFRFITFMIATALQTVFVHLFKQILFAGEPRPKTFFAEQIDQLNFVEGVTVRSYDSFPSGHTASGFLLFFFLILLVKSTRLRVIFFFAAVQVGLSRIYLLQHFARDVYVGSLFGILSVLMAWYIFKGKSEDPRLQKGLLVR